MKSLQVKILQFLENDYFVDLEEDIKSYPELSRTQLFEYVIDHIVSALKINPGRNAELEIKLIAIIKKLSKN